MTYGYVVLRHVYMLDHRHCTLLNQFANIPFATLRYIYIYIYIHCHPQTDCFVVSQLFSVATHVGRLNLGSKPAQIYVRLRIITFSQQANHVISGIIRHCGVAFVCLHLYLIGYQSAQFVRRALHYVSGSRKFLR